MTGERSGVGHHLLMWDAPNIDMTLSNIIDGKPDARTRPDLDVLAEWLVERAGDGDTLEACIFVNVPPHLTGPLRGWVLWLLDTGFRVFVKPKIGDSDVDDDMLDHLARTERDEQLAHVYVGSNDSRNFLDRLEDLARRDVGAHVLGFAEYAGGLAQSDLLDFVDLESIKGLFAQALPRLTLEDLPPAGRWFEPRASLLER